MKRIRWQEEKLNVDSIRRICEGLGLRERMYSQKWFMGVHSTCRVVTGNDLENQVKELVNSANVKPSSSAKHVNCFSIYMSMMSLNLIVFFEQQKREEQVGKAAAANVKKFMKQQKYR